MCRNESSQQEVSWGSAVRVGAIGSHDAAVASLLLKEISLVVKDDWSMYSLKYI